MNEKQLQENQQELFTHFSGEPRPVERVPSIAKTPKPILVSTTLEHILFACVLLILVFCLVFFLGVLRGRSMGTGLTSTPPAVSPAVSIRQVAPAVTVIQRAAPSQALPVSKPYTIQVLTTKKLAYAQNEAALLQKSGFNSGSARSGDYYVVCIGSYSGKEEAKKDLAYFAPKYKGAYLRRK